MPSCLIAGGGLAGLSCAAVLAEAGFSIDVYEARPFPGGRATSYTVPSAGGEGEEIDNCQHVLLRCCVNLLDFYRRLGVADQIRFHQRYYFLEPGGRTSVFQAGRLPAPAHFAGAFLRLRFLDWREKLAIGRAMLALQRERLSRRDLGRITMLDWLREKNQPARAIERFWRQILVSAVNEELDRMAARHGFQVMWLGFLAGRGGHEMGVPAVRLGRLYRRDVWQECKDVRLHCGHRVERLEAGPNGIRHAVLEGEFRKADYYVSAVPFERVPLLVPKLELDFAGWEHSPITGIHLWFDRPVTSLPHATLLGRTIQWFFNKEGGRYLELVVSASRELLPLSKTEVIDLALRELSEFLPLAREARVEKARVIKEVRATFSASPALDGRRPGAVTRLGNLFLAGDWTRTGWPATMEGAVRSGYLAAEAITRAAGSPRNFTLADIA